MTSRERVQVISDENSDAAHGAPAALNRPPARKRNRGPVAPRKLVVDSANVPTRQGRWAFKDIAKIVSGILVAVLIPAAVFVISDEAFSSRFFLVREVDVTGLKQVPRGAVERAAGLEHPRSVLTLQADEMRESIEALPWVKSVAIDISMHGTVQIAVTEAEFAGVVSAGELYLMDSGGDPIRRWTPADGAAAPLFVGFEKAIDKGVRIDRPAWLRARKLVLAFEASALGKKFDVAEVQASTGNSFRLLLSDGTEVRLRDDRLEQRLERLSDTLAQLAVRNEQPDYILLDGDSLQQVVFKAKQLAAVQPLEPSKN